MTEKKLWQEQARAIGGDELVVVIEEMARDIHTIKQTLTTAFPGGDVEGHRRYHQLMIERNTELRRLRIAIQEKTISGLIWALLVFLGLCIFSYFSGTPRPPVFPLPPTMGN